MFVFSTIILQSSRYKEKDAIPTNIPYYLIPPIQKTADELNYRVMSEDAVHVLQLHVPAEVIAAFGVFWTSWILLIG
jgi:hypothetical protein